MVGQGESPVPLQSQYIADILASKLMYKEKWEMYLLSGH